MDKLQQSAPPTVKVLQHQILAKDSLIKHQSSQIANKKLLEEDEDLAL